MSEKKRSGIHISITPEERAMIRRVCEAEDCTMTDAFWSLYEKRAKKLAKAGDLVDSVPDRKVRSGLTFVADSEQRQFAARVAASDTRTLPMQTIELFKRRERELIEAGKLEDTQ